MDKKQIEIFIAGCPVCESLVEMVQETAANHRDITIYNLTIQCKSKICLKKMEEYGITSVPTIVINRKILESGNDLEIMKRNLISALNQA